MIDFEESWVIAERTCFETLQEYLGGEEGKSCFRGYIPDGASSVWSFTSGDGRETQIGRLYGEDPCFGTLRFSAVCECQYNINDRDKCLAFAMGVLRALNTTGNLHNINNVQWLRLTDMPSEPAIVQAANGYSFWQVRVPMELIFNTN